MINIPPPAPAVQLELFEEKAWVDMYDAAPADWCTTFGLGKKETPDGVLFFCPAIPFVHFNCNNTPGLHGPMTAQALESMEQEYRARNCPKVFCMVSPNAEPNDLQEQLAGRGYKAELAWERVYRDSAALKPLLPTHRHLRVQEVNDSNSQEWADFICKTYGLPNQPWLLALVNRKGWHHFILREKSRIAEVRTYYTDGENAWIGIDAPVPGAMTDDFEADYHLVHAMVEDCLARGVKNIIADIEMPDDTGGLASYRYFKELGFTILYRRMVYAKGL